MDTAEKRPEAGVKLETFKHVYVDAELDESEWV